MSNDPSNPYPSQSGGGMQPPMQPVTGIDYMRMITYVFENPNWLMNLLLGALFVLIVLVGWIALLGYGVEVVIALAAAGGTRYPDISFSRFGDYLMRGVWPFLVYLLGYLVLSPIHFGAMYLARSGPLGGLGALPLILVLTVVFVFAIQPMMFRAALALNFAEAFKFDWLKDFVTRIWVEMLIGTIFLSVCGSILGPVGIVCCGVGLLVVIPLMVLAHASFYYQLYSLYLSRGGTPIPVRMTGQPVVRPM